MTVLDYVLQPWSLDGRSFIAGAIVALMFSVASMAIILLLHWIRETLR